MQRFRQALYDHWGIDARLDRLDGEYDLNFRALPAEGAPVIVKVMRPECDPSLVAMQLGALARLRHLPFPQVVLARDGAALCEVVDDGGAARLMWVMTCLPGQCYAATPVKSDALIADLGRVLGASDLALAGFDHPGLVRAFKWDLTQGLWIADHLDAVTDPARRARLDEIIAGFRACQPALEALPVQAIHNDANDYNILVSAGLTQAPRVSGLIDLGDMCSAPRVCNLAIAGAYVVLDHPAPARALAALVAGYHAANPLSAGEVDLIWPLLRLRLAVSVVNATLMAREVPDDPYVTISQAPAWRFLEGDGLGRGLVTARLRAACNLPVVPGAERVRRWLDTERGRFAPVLGRALDALPLGALSVEDSLTPRDPFQLMPDEAARIGAAQGKWWLGAYAEPRLINTGPAVYDGPYKASDRRTLHLGVDVFAPAGTALQAPLDGTVVAVETQAAPLGLGGLLVLAHDTPEGDRFYTLYGHLDPESLAPLRPSARLARGAALGRLGAPGTNGGWAPHLHLQILLAIDGLTPDWPTVANPDERALWQALCPNPAALLNLPDAAVCRPLPDKSAVLAGRQARFGDNLRLTYRDPVMLVRGWRHHMFDEWGRPYLDAYNNVPHVGHAHPRLAAIAAEQMARLNTNTRYLHRAQLAFAETLCAKLPAGLEVCYFVNSGSEANELALRLARAQTGAKGMVTPDHGYHGNTTGAIDLSAYKFNAPGGVGPSDWVALVDSPDDYRGAFRRDDPERGVKFAAQVEGAIARLGAAGHGLAGFIAETFPSVGGQIIPPPGYLASVYDRIRAAGGVLIADEVQTGLGRLGHAYFGFEQQGVVPDIVVLGKPLGNGHPIGAVVTTRAIADRFAEGPEFFSTFGGATLSCRIGKAVLDIVDDEGLQDNAARMGAHLMGGLEALQRRHPSIGDLRGMGLFLGVELVRPDGSEATEACAYVKNRLCEHRILIGSEGPRDNVLKIRPPLTIDAEDCDMLLATLDAVLDEVERLSGW